MTGRVGMSFGRTEQAAAALRTASDHIAATLDSLNSELSRLAPQWSGQAADTYNQAAAKAAAALAGMNAVLAEAEKTTTTRATRLREAETRAAALWQ